MHSRRRRQRMLVSCCKFDKRSTRMCPILLAFTPNLPALFFFPLFNIFIADTIGVFGVSIYDELLCYLSLCPRFSKYLSLTPRAVVASVAATRPSAPFAG